MTEPLCRTVRVRCSVAHAFHVFTGRIDLWWPPGHRRFEGSSLILEPFAGGRFVEHAPDGQEALLGQVIDCDPPNSISYTWNPGKVDLPTHVAIRFAEDGSDTVVEVVHSEGDAAIGDLWPERAALFTRGWGIVLPAFAAHAERTAHQPSIRH